MWICPLCNQLEPNPVNRKCRNGHGLADATIFAVATVEKPAWKAFINAALVCIGVTIAVAVGNALIPGQPLGKNALGYPLVFFMALGVVALRRAFKWSRQGGPVTRLVPRAVGMGLGCILTGAGLFALGLNLGLFH